MPKESRGSDLIPSLYKKGEKIMIVVIKEPHKEAEVVDIENSLNSIQSILNGYFESVSFTQELIMLVNEEGKLLGLEPNIMTVRDVLFGTIIVVAFDGVDDFRSLTVKEIDFILRYLKTAEELLDISRRTI